MCVCVCGHLWCDDDRSFLFFFRYIDLDWTGFCFCVNEDVENTIKCWEPDKTFSGMKTINII